MKHSYMTKTYCNTLGDPTSICLKVTGPLTGDSDTCCHGPAEFTQLNEGYRHVVCESPNCSLFRIVL